jgi:hypothetical protein
MLKVFKEYPYETSILDDFTFYEKKQDNIPSEIPDQTQPNMNFYEGKIPNNIPGNIQGGIQGNFQSNMQSNNMVNNTQPNMNMMHQQNMISKGFINKNEESENRFLGINQNIGKNMNQNYMNQGSMGQNINYNNQFNNNNLNSMNNRMMMNMQNNNNTGSSFNNPINNLNNNQNNFDQQRQGLTKKIIKRTNSTENILQNINKEEDFEQDENN